MRILAHPLLGALVLSFLSLRGTHGQGIHIMCLLRIISRKLASIQLRDE